MTPARSALVAGTALGVLLVSGCSAEEAPPPVAQPTPVQSPTVTQPSLNPTLAPTPTSSPPANSDREAEAGRAARAWFESANQAISTGDTAALRAASADDCVSCQRLIRSIEQVYTGGSFEGGLVKLIYAEAPGTDKEEVEVDLLYDVSKATALDGSGRVIFEEEEALGTQGTMLVRRTGSEWVVASLEQLEP